MDDIQEDELDTSSEISPSPKPIEEETRDGFQICTDDSMILPSTSSQTPDVSHSKKRKRSPTKSRPNKMMSLEIVPEEVMEIIKTGFDDMLEAKTEKTGLTASHVKSIIKHVMCDKNVLDMINNTVNQGDELSEATYVPKLTRAKTKELIQQQTDVDRSTLESSVSGVPIPGGVGSSWNREKWTENETSQLFTKEFPDDDEDEEEYNPDNEENSEDESLLSSTGDSFHFGSPRFQTSFDDSSQASSAVTPSSVKTQVTSTPNSAGSNKEEGKFIRPAAKIVPRSLSFEAATKEELIFQRTRSKKSLSDTPLEKLEMAFRPPDITKDMYEMECDNTDWKNFLIEFIDPSSSKTNEEDEQADPEYNFLEDAQKLSSYQDEEDKEDRIEEMRKDRGVRITKKEYNTLINELLDSFDSNHAPSENCFTPVIPNEFVLSPASPKSTSSDERDVMENLQQQPQNEDVIRVEIITAEFSQHHMSLLQNQMMQHIQLLATTVIMANKEPMFSEITEGCKKYLEELDTNAKNAIYYDKENTVYNPPNLQPALDIVRKFENIPQFKMEKGSVFNQQKRIKPNGPPYLNYYATDLMIQSAAFPFLSLLPVNMFSTYIKKPNSMFTTNEDLLLAHGIECFLKSRELIKDSKKSSRSLLRDILNKITKTYFPGKCLAQIEARFKHWKNYKDFNEPLPPVLQALMAPNRFSLPSAEPLPIPYDIPCPLYLVPLCHFESLWKEAVIKWLVFDKKKEKIMNILVVNKSGNSQENNTLIPLNITTTDTESISSSDNVLSPNPTASQIMDELSSITTSTEQNKNINTNKNTNNIIKSTPITNKSTQSKKNTNTIIDCSIQTTPIKAPIILNLSPIKTVKDRKESMPQITCSPIKTTQSLNAINSASNSLYLITQPLITDNGNEDVTDTCSNVKLHKTPSPKKGEASPEKNINTNGDKKSRFIPIRSPVKTSPMKQVNPILKKYIRIKRNKRRKILPKLKAEYLKPVKPKNMKSAAHNIDPNIEKKPPDKTSDATNRHSMLKWKSNESENNNEELLDLNEHLPTKPLSEEDDFQQSGEEVLPDEDKENEEHLEALLKASSTISKRCYKPHRKPSMDNAIKSRLQGRLGFLSCQLNSELSDKMFAQQYILRVNEAVTDKTLMVKFLEVLSQFSSKGNDRSLVALYKEVSEILKDFPDLATEFLLFIEPHQAVELGMFDKYTALVNSKEFIQKLLIHFNKQPQQVQKIFKTMQQLLEQTNLSIDLLKSTMTPLFKNSQLLNSFMKCFSNISSEILSTDFEDIDIDEPPSPDNSEHISLSELEIHTSSNKLKCKCNCHTTTSNQETMHTCMTCGVRFIDGRIYLKCGKTLRPAKVTITDPNEPPQNDKLSASDISKSTNCENDTSSKQKPKISKGKENSENIVRQPREKKNSTSSQDGECKSDPPKNQKNIKEQEDTSPKSKKSKVHKGDKIYNIVSPENSAKSVENTHEVEKSKENIKDNVPVKERTGKGILKSSECSDANKTKVGKNENNFKTNQCCPKSNESTVCDTNEVNQEINEFADLRKSKSNQKIDNLNPNEKDNSMANAKIGKFCEDNLDNDIFSMPVPTPSVVENSEFILSDIPKSHLELECNLETPKYATEMKLDSSWSKSEDMILLNLMQVQNSDQHNFKELAKKFRNKTTKQVEERFMFLMKMLIEESTMDNSVSSEDSFC